MDDISANPISHFQKSDSSESCWLLSIHLFKYLGSPQLPTEWGMGGYESFNGHYWVWISLAVVFFLTCMFFELKNKFKLGVVNISTIYYAFRISHHAHLQYIHKLIIQCFNIDVYSVFARSTICGVASRKSLELAAKYVTVFNKIHSQFVQLIIHHLQDQWFWGKKDRTIR